MSLTSEAEEIIRDLAVLFKEESMDQMDAADFKDKAGDTFSLVERARDVVAGMDE